MEATSSSTTRKEEEDDAVLVDDVDSKKGSTITQLPLLFFDHKTAPPSDCRHVIRQTLLLLEQQDDDRTAATAATTTATTAATAQDDDNNSTTDKKQQTTTEADLLRLVTMDDCYPERCFQCQYQFPYKASSSDSIHSSGVKGSKKKGGAHRKKKKKKPRFRNRFMFPLSRLLCLAGREGRGVGPAEEEQIEISLSTVQAYYRAYPQAVSTLDKDGMLPLHYAARYGVAKNIIDFLISCHPPAIDTPTQYGAYLPFSYAVRFHHDTSVIFDSLMKPNSSIKCRTSNLSLPLHLACLREEEEQLPLQQSQKNENSDNDDDDDPAAVTATSNASTSINTTNTTDTTFEIVERLLELYPRAVRVQDQSGFLPLHNLCREAHFLTNTKLFKLVLDAYPDAVRMATLAFQQVPLHIASVTAAVAWQEECDDNDGRCDEGQEQEPNKPPSSPPPCPMLPTLELLVQSSTEPLFAKTTQGKTPLDLAKDQLVKRRNGGGGGGGAAVIVDFLTKLQTKWCLDIHNEQSPEQQEQTTPATTMGEHDSSKNIEPNKNATITFAKGNDNDRQEDSSSSSLPLYFDHYKATYSDQRSRFREALIRNESIINANSSTTGHSLPAPFDHDCDRALQQLVRQNPKICRFLYALPSPSPRFASSSNTSSSKRNETRFYPLHYICCRKPSLELVKQVYNAHPAAIQTPEAENEKYPLHIACRRGANEAVVLFLLAMFPQAARRATSNGMLPLHFACGNSQGFRVIQALVEQYPEAVKIPHAIGFLRPLHFACMARDKHDDATTGDGLRIINYLIECYPSALDMSGRAKCLPLHYACMNQRSLEEIRILVAGRPAAIRASTRRGERPLHLCCNHIETTDVSVLEYLCIMDPSSIVAVQNKNETPLDIALTKQLLAAESSRAADTVSSNDETMASKIALLRTVHDNLATLQSLEALEDRQRFIREKLKQEQINGPEVSDRKDISEKDERDSVDGSIYDWKAEMSNRRKPPPSSSSSVPETADGDTTTQLNTASGIRNLKANVAERNNNKKTRSDDENTMIHNDVQNDVPRPGAVHVPGPHHFESSSSSSSSGAHEADTDLGATADDLPLPSQPLAPSTTLATVTPIAAEVAPSILELEAELEDYKKRFHDDTVARAIVVETPPPQGEPTPSKASCCVIS